MIFTYLRLNSDYTSIYSGNKIKRVVCGLRKYGFDMYTISWNHANADLFTFPGNIKNVFIPKNKPLALLSGNSVVETSERNPD